METTSAAAHSQLLNNQHPAAIMVLSHTLAPALLAIFRHASGSGKRLFQNAMPLASACSHCSGLRLVASRSIPVVPAII